MSRHKTAGKPRETEENIAKLKAKLRELFQLDRGDLDFGLYRIMALKSAEVENFLDKHLLPQVAEALGEIAEADSKTAQSDLDNAIKAIEKFGGIDPEDADVVKDARLRLAAARAGEQAEALTYHHLCTFFSRYYDQGDFMSLRRYKSAGRKAYSIPYNGEEVKLHWANADQYYIKTTENYASYMFTVNKDGKECSVRFEIAAADNEKDNVKEIPGNSRRFILAKNFAAERKDGLAIRFDHRPLTEAEKIKYPENGIKQQAAINAGTEQRISKALEPGWLNALAVPCPTETNGGRTLLGKHITAYTSKNSFDYFIHKDLGGFLRRELDYYLKNEVIAIDNLELADDPVVFRRNLAQVKAVKNVGNKIIDFLAQLENFQKQLWLKKKFVLETQYCVTLDRAPQSLYPEIAKNKAQREEWVDLLAIDEIKGDLGNGNTGYTKPLSVEFLKTNPFLVLDTRHFNQGFKDKLLASLSETGPIEEQMNGLLVHGENFQALNLLQERYKEQVRCVYIDPPFNTDASVIMYKNGYKHSSWLALIHDRLVMAKQLLGSEQGVLCCLIDDVEQKNLSHLIEQVFDEVAGTVSIRIKPSGRPIPTGFALSHEYAIFARKNLNNSIARLAHSKRQIERYKDADEKGRFFWESFRKAGSNSNRTDRPTMFYPFFVNAKTGAVRLAEMKYDKNTASYNLLESCTDDEIEVFPIKDNGEDSGESGEESKGEGCWYFGYDRAKKAATEFKAVRRGDNEYSIYYRRRMNIGVQPTTHWSASKYSATEHGTALLKALFGQQEVFSYPKSIHAVEDCLRVSGASEADDILVLDYFAGSGTTGHAVINLNREDGGDRKYILVEVGHHFDAVLLPRMKKATYSGKWKDGKPGDRDGVSQLFKYIRLESYEDTMDSLKVTPKGNDWADKAKDREFLEDYHLRYALGEETADSASLASRDFSDPFNYTLSVVRDGVRRDETVDLPETFNLLLGLRVKSRRQTGGVLTITGTNRQGENCLVLWRNLEEMDNDNLNKWFAQHRKTFGDNLDLVYVNGDHALNKIATPKDKWKAVAAEPVFRKLMFAEGT